jgi:hypothetical protein
MRAAHGRSHTQAAQMARQRRQLSASAGEGATGILEALLGKEGAESLPNRGVVADRVLLGGRGRQKAEEMVRPRGRANGQEEPGGLQIRDVLETIQEDLLFLPALFRKSLHEGIAAEGRAEDHEPVFGRRTPARPYVRPQLSYTWGRLAAARGPHATFAHVDVDPGAKFDGCSDFVEGLACPGPRRDEVYVIEECPEPLFLLQPILRRHEWAVQSQGEESGHQRISLFSALSLPYRASVARGVFPEELRRLWIKEPHEWHEGRQGRVVQEPFEHRLAIYVVEGPHAIYGYDHGFRVQRGRRSEEMTHCIRPGSGRQGELKRSRGLIDLLDELLCQGLGHEAPVAIARHNASHSSPAPIKSRHATNSDGAGN